MFQPIDRSDSEKERKETKRTKTCPPTERLVSFSRLSFLLSFFLRAALSGFCCFFLSFFFYDQNLRVGSQLGFRDDGPLPPDSSTLGLGQPLKIMKPTNQPQPNQIIRDQRKKDLKLYIPRRCKIEMNQRSA